MRAGRFVLPLLLTAGLACTSFEASTNPADPVDAGGDAPESLTLPPGDADDAGLVPRARFCAEDQARQAGVVLCDDFDDPAQPGISSAWTRQLVDPNSPAGAESGEALGRRGNVFRVRLGPTAGSRHAGLLRELAVDLPSTAQLFELRFRFYVASCNTNFARLGAFIWIANGVTGSVYKSHGVAIYGKALAVVDGADESGDAAISQAAGSWHVAVVSLVRKQGGFLRTVVVDGRMIDMLEGSLFPQGTPGDEAFHVALGAFDTSTDQGPLDVAFDDVLVRTL